MTACFPEFLDESAVIPERAMLLSGKAFKDRVTVDAEIMQRLSGVRELIRCRHHPHLC